MFNIKHQTFLITDLMEFQNMCLLKIDRQNEKFFICFILNMNVIYMSYSDYLRKLNFSAVVSGVQNMKNNEFSKLANPINQQIDEFQTDIEGLQKSLADQSASLGNASSIREMAGGLAAQKGMSKMWR